MTAAVDTTVPQYTSQFASTHVTFGRMLKSEWLKLWTLRSTWWSTILTIALMAGFSLLFASLMNWTINDLREQAGADAPTIPPAVGVLIVTIGYSLAQLTVAILGVLTISNEYRSGMIRATLAATPRRLRVLWSKVIVITTATVLIAIVGLALSWLVTLPILSNKDIAIDFAEGSTIRSLVGVVLYLVMIAWMSLGLGTLLRHTAGGIATIMGILMVLPTILGIIVQVASVDWLDTAYAYLPTEAGSQIIANVGDIMVSFGGSGDAGGATGPMGGATGIEMLDAWPGFAVLAGYAVLALVAGAIRIKRSDA